MKPSINAQTEEMAVQGYTVIELLFTLEEMVHLDRALEAHEERLAREGLEKREVVFTQKIAERDDQIRAFAQRDELVVYF